MPSTLKGRGFVIIAEMAGPACVSRKRPRWLSAVEAVADDDWPFAAPFTDLPQHGLSLTEVRLRIRLVLCKGHVKHMLALEIQFAIPRGDRDLDLLVGRIDLRSPCRLCCPRP